MAADEPQFRSVGAEILCHPDVADDILRQLRDAVAEGQITDTAGEYLLVLLDGEDTALRLHPTNSLAYLTRFGWVQATPLPDPTPTC